jgi:hypothetical protein
MTTTPRPAASASSADADPLDALDAPMRSRLAAVADRLIPAEGGMPSAAQVVTDDRLRFVLNARPDLLEPLRAALRAELGDDEITRLDVLGRDEPATLYALQLVIVAGYYTDAGVRELIGYPGQMALTLRSWEVPAYIDEGLVDAVLARGPVWRDPATGARAQAVDAPRTYAERFAAPPEGDSDGHDGA